MNNTVRNFFFFFFLDFKRNCGTLFWSVCCGAMSKRKRHVSLEPRPLPRRLRIVREPTSAADTAAKEILRTPPSDVALSFSHQLIHHLPKTRADALQKLSLYIHRSAPLTDADCVHLWKPLFYAFWMSDRSRIQHELALRIAATR